MFCIPHFLDNRQTDGGVSLTHHGLFTTNIFLCFWYSFLLQTEQIQCLMRLKRPCKMKKNSMTSSGLEPMTFQLVAYLPNQLRYRVPPSHTSHLWQLKTYVYSDRNYTTITVICACSVLHFLNKNTIPHCTTLRLQTLHWLEDGQRHCTAQ
jgi:hypothetical protein